MSTGSRLPSQESAKKSLHYLEWRSGSYVLLERNPHYWRASEVAIPFVRYENTQDPATELRRYRAGELDITYTIPGQQTRWIDEHLRDQLHVAPQLGAITTASTCEPRRSPTNRSYARPCRWSSNAIASPAR